MKYIPKMFPVALASLVLVACSAEQEERRQVDASGKQGTALEAVPDEVLAAAMAASPELEILEAEYETRDGNEYYDVGGTLPDGSELELDMTRIDGVWAVVEFQRDIGMDLVPPAVAAALAAGVPDWTPTRIIESDQGDGTIIYEFFGPGDGAEPTKHEVKWTEGSAELLVDEWVH
mgnify:CR=1 FL=1